MLLMTKHSPEIQRLLRSHKQKSNASVHDVKQRAQHQIINYLQLLIYKLNEHEDGVEQEENHLLEFEISNLLKQLNSTE